MSQKSRNDRETGETGGKSAIRDARLGISHIPYLVPHIPYPASRIPHPLSLVSPFPLVMNK